MKQVELSKQPITTIKQLLSQPVDDETLAILGQDERKGVKELLLRYDKVQKKRAQLKEDYLRKFIYEQAVKNEGYQLICGVDEVGRGPLAGPVVAAAVILPEACDLMGLTDSSNCHQQSVSFSLKRFNNKRLLLVLVSFHRMLLMISTF